MNRFASHAVVVVALTFSSAALAQTVAAQTVAPVGAAGRAEPPAAAGPAPPAGPTPAEIMPPSAGSHSNAGSRSNMVAPGDVEFRQGHGGAEVIPHRVNA